MLDSNLKNYVTYGAERSCSGSDLKDALAPVDGLISVSGAKTKTAFQFVEDDADGYKVAREFVQHLRASGKKVYPLLLSFKPTMHDGMLCNVLKMTLMFETD